MRKGFVRAAVLAAGFAGVASTASATVYVNQRWCGGTTFATCAAVHLDVTGTTVTLRLWNLAGNYWATGVNTPSNTIFNAIGMYNVPAAVNVTASANSALATSGPIRVGNPGTPGAWRLRQNQTIGFLIDFGAQTGTTPPWQNGLASGCAAPGTLPTNVNLYINPCSNPSSLNDYLTITFQVNQTWNATNTQFVFRGFNPRTGQGSECYTGPAPNGAVANCFPVSTVPEPMTMALLATGLVGLGGVGYLRRRKAQSQA